jgi:two-component system cell cycle sensor histidine kinase/response regulator CckA
MSTGVAVLVVDDDEDVLALAVRALRLGGHDVSSASSGSRGIVESRAREQLDLLVTDLVMPGLPGVDLAEVLLSERHDLRVLFATGTDDPEVRAAAAAAGHRLLEKPYTPAALLAAVADVMASPPAHEAVVGLPDGGGT